MRKVLRLLHREVRPHCRGVCRGTSRPHAARPRLEPFPARSAALVSVMCWPCWRAMTWACLQPAARVLSVPSSGGTATWAARSPTAHRGKILVSGGKAVGVRLANGEEHAADAVISAADGHSTLFGMLEGRYGDDALRARYRDWKLIKPWVMISFGVAREFPANRTSPLTVSPSRLSWDAARREPWHAHLQLRATLRLQARR